MELANDHAIDLPLLGAVIVHHEAPSLLGQCLTSLSESSLRPDKIVVIDNSGPDSAAAASGLVAEMKHVTRHKMPTNVGFAQAANAGLEALDDCDIVILVNQDATADPECIGRLVGYLRANSEVGAASPLILNDSGRVWFAGGSFNQWKGRVDLVDFARPPRVYSDGSSPFVSGCFLAIRTQAYQDVGPFNPNTFLYYEDVEWSDRMLSSNWESHLVASAVAHHQRGSHGDADRNLSPVMLRYETAGRLRFIRGYLSGPRRVTALAYTALILARRTYLVARARHPSWRDQFAGMMSGLKDGLTLPPLRPPSDPLGETQR